jgi:hypothetical protein
MKPDDSQFYHKNPPNIYQANSSQFTSSQPISQRFISVKPPFLIPVVCQSISVHGVLNLRRIKFILIKIFKCSEVSSADVNIIICLINLL